MFNYFKREKYGTLQTVTIGLSQINSSDCELEKRKTGRIDQITVKLKMNPLQRNNRLSIKDEAWVFSSN